MPEKDTSAPRPDSTDALEMLWGARAIARFIGVPERRCFYMLEQQLIPGTKVGATWTSSRARLRRHLNVEAA